MRRRGILRQFGLVLCSFVGVAFLSLPTGMRIQVCRADDVVDEEMRSTIASDPAVRKKSKKTPRKSETRPGDSEGAEWKTMHSEKRRPGKKVSAAVKPSLKIDEKTQKIETLKISFLSNSDQPTAASLAVLKRLAAQLAARPEATIRIEGHADSVGYDQENMEISQKRAERVKEVLVKEGIGAERIEAVGKGDRHPVASSETPAGQEKNRRVEFYVTGTAPRPEAPETQETVPSVTPPAVVQPETLPAPPPVVPTPVPPVPAQPQTTVAPTPQAPTPAPAASPVPSPTPPLSTTPPPVVSPPPETGPTPPANP